MKKQKKLGKASGVASVSRTPRMRYVEPPGKRKGNPFVAFRMDGGVIKAFASFAKKRYPKASNPSVEMLRAFMLGVASVPGPVIERMVTEGRFSDEGAE